MAPGSQFVHVWFLEISKSEEAEYYAEASFSPLL